MSNATENIVKVARALESIREYRLVFAGASILPLLIDDPAAQPARPTLDVDLAVLVSGSYSQWQRLQSRLRDCGLVERADDPVGKARICLFHLGQLEVDVMPVDLPRSGCQSRILELGAQFPEPCELEDDLWIHHLSAPSFLAAKLAAFADRGEREAHASKDLADIIMLFEGRTRLTEEISATVPEINQFIARQMRRLLGHDFASEVVHDSLRDPKREQMILGKMDAVAIPLH